MSCMVDATLSAPVPQMPPDENHPARASYPHAIPSQITLQLWLGHGGTGRLVGIETRSRFFVWRMFLSANRRPLRRNMR